MSKNRLIILAFALMLGLYLSACSGVNNTAPVDNSGSVVQSNESMANSDRNDSAVASVEESAEIPSDGDFSIEVLDDGDYSFENNILTIKEAGSYVLSGELEGQVVVSAPEDAKVKLKLNGVDISYSDGAPIFVESADAVKISAVAGSANTVRDERPMRELKGEEKPDVDRFNADAAIYSACDLTLKGEGALEVSSSYWNGIHTRDDLIVRELRLNVTSVNSSLKGNDSITVESGTLELIASQGNGLKTSNFDVSSKGKQRGTVSVQGGDITIYAARDGIDAAFNADISGEGTLTILTDTYSSYSEEIITEEEASTEEETVQPPFGGPFPGMEWGGKARTLTYSCKGIKADNAVVISGATITISSTDDGIHANNDAPLMNDENGEGVVTIDGGIITITSGDDAIHADGALTFNDGSVTVLEAYEGYEGSSITINGGTHDVYASDDGFNASSGDRWTSADITINGGTIKVKTPSGDTDAIDANGSFTMNGGWLLVQGGNTMGGVAGSVDVDGSITVTGGTIAAIGGVCETPKESCNAYVLSGVAFPAGDYLVTDAAGNEIMSFTLTEEYRNGWLCSDALLTDMTYTLTRDGEVVVEWTQSEGTMGQTGFGGFGFGPPGGGGFGGPPRS